MKPVDDELFAHIKESLTEHEEAYIPGAWERFEKKDGKKTVWLWFASLSSAAAVLLIGLTFLYPGDKIQVNEVPQQVKNTPSNQHVDAGKGNVPDVAVATTAIEKIKTKVAEHKNTIGHRTDNNGANNPIVTSVQAVPTIVQTIGSKEQPNVSNIQSNVSPIQRTIGSSNEIIVSDKKDVIAAAASTEVIAKVNAKEKDSVKINKTRSFQEFLDAEVKSNSAIAALKSSAKKADKWEMGLMVAPSMGNAKKLNMGYGVSMDYVLSNKVSISSGISYNEMAATKSMAGNGQMMDAPSNMAIVNDTKSLKSVDANLVGIDIPLGIKYHLSKKFYTNLGVSAFAILNQKQNNNYLQGSVEYAATADASNANGFKALFQQQTVSEAVPSGEIRGDKYLGFYNVSFGFKQPISGSKAFSVEPFMKLPMKEFTKENLYLIGTGVRLKFDF